jgi:sulfur-oxidizing protein SoxB
MGRRIDDMRLDGVPIDPDKTYRVAGWAPVAEGAQGEPIWEVVEAWLRANRRVAPRQPERPRLVGVEGNPGMA